LGWFRPEKKDGWAVLTSKPTHPEGQPWLVLRLGQKVKNKGLWEKYKPTP